MTISKVYAKALIELNNDYDSVLDDLKILKSLYEQSSDFTQIINNPTVSLEIKCEIIDEILQNKVKPEILKFLNVLASKNRLSLLPEIIDEYEKEIDEIQNIKRVIIVSAVNLSDTQKEKVKSKLENILNKTILTDYKIDKNIIGGLIIKIDDDVFDSSIKNKLEKYKGE